MHLINNHINGRTKCERLQIEHGRIPRRTSILVSATPTNILVSPEFELIWSSCRRRMFATTAIFLLSRQYWIRCISQVSWTRFEDLWNVPKQADYTVYIIEMPMLYCQKIHGFIIHKYGLKPFSDNLNVVEADKTWENLDVMLLAQRSRWALNRTQFPPLYVFWHICYSKNSKTVR